MGATSKRSKRVTKQVYVDVVVGEIKTKAICLVVANLVREVILGVDWLTENRVIIDFITQSMKINDQETDSHLVTMHKYSQEEDRKITVIQTVENYPYNQSVDEVHHKETKMQINEITSIIEKLDLSSRKKDMLHEVLLQNKEVFQDSPGRIKGFECKLNIKNDEEYFERNYPVPYAYKGAVDIQINKMLEAGVIERTTSPYINPLVVVIKKDGAVRLCLDARQLNRRLVPEHESPCPPQEILQSFGEFKWLTNLDLVASYWQVPLKRESRPYTAFKYRENVYAFTVLPFGLSISVSAFIRALNHVLGFDIEHFCKVYVDDLIIFSRTFEEHIQHLSIVLKRVKHAGATINLSKSRFFQDSVPFLGHILSNQGLRPDPCKIELIQSWPRPRNPRQLKGFLGLCSFFRVYACTYACATIPLQELLKKGNKWRWTERQEEAFNNVKTLFLETVQLKFPQYDKPFFLRCDASDYGLGAYLFQIDEAGNERVISMASRILRINELNFTISEKELLACVWALMKFRIFILGTDLTIITDHKALTFLMRSRLLSSRLSRWILLIQQFDFKIVHSPGRLNIVADILSRFPIKENGEIVEANGNTHDVIIAPIIQAIEPELRKKIRKIEQFQAQDEKFSTIINEINQDNAAHADKYIIHNNKLFYRKEVNTHWKLCLPKVLAAEVIESIHRELGHYGANKCLTVILEHFYCQHLSRLVRKVIGACDVCQRKKHPTRIEHGTYTPIIPTGIGQLVSVDIFGPLPRGQRNLRYIIVFLDVFSKLTKLYPIVRQTASAVTSKVKEYMNNVQKPVRILSDHGTQFTSRQWNETLEEAGVKAYLSSIRHPASNPVERVMREIGRILRTYCSNNHAGWVKWIPNVEKILNSIYHESTGYTPIELHFNRKAAKPKVVSLFKSPLGETIEIPHDAKILLASERLRSKAEKRRMKHELRYPKKTIFQLGEQVLVKSLNVSDLSAKKCKKFFDIYEGPYEIAALAGTNAYELVDDRGRSKGVFNVVNLKHYKKLP